MAHPFQHAQNVLAKMAYARWLKVHGKLKRPEMSKKQQLELRECFELIDSGGSGAIATHEVPLAFSVLGMDVKGPEIDAMLAEVNPENRRIIEYPQFMQIMLTKLDRLPCDAYAPRDDGKDPSTQYSLPFSLLAQAYRRKKLIEAVMGGDKPLQDRMNYRSGQVDKERRALRDEAAGKPVQEPEKTWSMTHSQSQRAKRRPRAAELKQRESEENTPEPVHVPSYLVTTMDADVKEVLLGNKSKSYRKAASASKVTIVPPEDKPGNEIYRPWSVDGGPSTANLSPMNISPTASDSKVEEAYKQEKLEVFRSVLWSRSCPIKQWMVRGTWWAKIQHKPTFKQQVIHVQAMKTLRDFHKHGLWEVQGSPFVFPASRRPSLG